MSSLSCRKNSKALPRQLLLPDREKKMLGVYYEQGLNLREIGDVLGVTESRVCQLHKRAIAALRRDLGM